MGKIFDMDGSLYKLLTVAYNLIIINVLLIVTSLPIVTIGISITAAFSILKESKNGQSLISVKRYIYYIKKYSRISIKLLMLQVGILAFFVPLILIFSSVSFVQLLLIILLSVSMLVMSWTYVLVSQKQLDIKSAVSLSGFIALKLSAYSVIFFLIPIFALIVPVFIPAIIYPYVFFIFSLPIYLQLFIAELVIDKIENDYEWSS